MKRAVYPFSAAQKYTVLGAQLNTLHETADKMRAGYFTQYPTSVRDTGKAIAEVVQECGARPDGAADYAKIELRIALAGIIADMDATPSAMAADWALRLRKLQDWV